MKLVAPGTDEWTAMFAVDTIGWHEYSIAAWVDRFRTWRRDLEIKAAAGQDVSVLGWGEYGERFATVVGRNNVFGVQFHPEKSSSDGLALLANFARLAA